MKKALEIKGKAAQQSPKVRFREENIA